MGWSPEDWTLEFKGSRDPVGQWLPYRFVLSTAEAAMYVPRPQCGPPRSECLGVRVPWLGPGG